MRVYHFRCTMNLKAAFVLILTVLVIFGYSFYRYFYHQEYPVKYQISNTISSGKVFERDEVLIEPLSMGKDEIKARTTPKTSTKERTEQRKDSEINFLPNTVSEEKAKKEFFEQLDELSRQNGINVTDGTDKSADKETLLNENRTREYNMDGFLNTNKTFVGNGKAGVNDEEDEIEENRNLEMTNRNKLAEEVKKALKKNGTDDEENAELVQQNMVKLMSNLSELFYKDFYNVTSMNSSDLLNTSEGLARSNETLQDLQSSIVYLSRTRGRSAVNLRKRKGRRISKKNTQNIFKQRVKSKVKRKRHHGTKKGSRSKKKSSLSKDNVHYKSSLHEEGHNGKREQHKSIHPNKKMLTNLETNFKIDYREGYVLDETFFREAKLKPVYNIKKRKRSVLLLHPSAFTSSVWVNIGTMQALAESGYRNIAIDLPGYGRSNSSIIPYSRSEIIDYMIQLLQYLGLEKPVIVTPSRSGDYVMPLIMSHPYMIGGFVAISPTDTGKYSRHFYENLGVPSLVVLGKEDTSMLNWASLDNLEHLKVRRIFTIANATKECYVDRPSSFHKLLLDFLPSLAVQTSQ